MHACVLREEQREAAGKPPPAGAEGRSGDSAERCRPSPDRTFVAPPRTIADITAILDSEKPDDAKIAERKANADATPPTNASPAKLAQFYYDRGSARALLARNKDALADGLQALAVGKGALELPAGLAHSAIRGAAIPEPSAIRNRRSPHSTQSCVEGRPIHLRGAMINALANIAGTLVSMGDVNQANTYAGRVEALVQEARGSPQPALAQRLTAIYGHSWEADADAVRAVVFEARGQYAEAEAAYRRAEAFRRAAVKDLSQMRIIRRRRNR